LTGLTGLKWIQKTDARDSDLFPFNILFILLILSANDSISELVVILVRANPNPLDAIIEPLSNSAVMIADTDRESLPRTAL
jgi:hypothetical protein